MNSCHTVLLILPERARCRQPLVRSVLSHDEKECLIRQVVFRDGLPRRLLCHHLGRDRNAFDLVFKTDMTMTVDDVDKLLQTSEYELEYKQEWDKGEWRFCNY